MRKWILTCAGILLFKVALCNQLSEVRQLYMKAADSETVCRQLLQKLSGSGERDKVLSGYQAAATIIMAKHLSRPSDKMSSFNKGKKMLEAMIFTDTGNVELRYIRLTIQAHLPGFLGYRKQMNTDKYFLRKALTGLQDKELKLLVSGFLKTLEPY